MPITTGVYKVCYEDADIKRQAMALMTRDVKDENAGLHDVKM